MTGSKEGSLEAPKRHPINWQDERFYDENKIEAELRRVFDICHGCRRCFNLCDSFPKLFDMIDDSPNEQVDDLTPVQLAQVVDSCTLCDMCYMTKCPYVPPHEFDLDFPHLMLRHRAAQHAKGETGWVDRQLAETDRNGKWGNMVSGVVNWASSKDNRLTRPMLEKVTGIDARASLPEFADISLYKQSASAIAAPNSAAPGFGRKVAFYASCYDMFNDQAPAKAALNVLAHNGVACRIEHPECCAMPKYEHGDLPAVAGAAERVAAHFVPLIDQGYDIIAVTTSCALMLKSEWPLMLPDNQDVRKLAEHSYDISQYIVDLAKSPGLVALDEMPSSISMHFACHARAQNMGPKALEMLRLISGAKAKITERCSGHGGKWGIKSGNFEIAEKLARPTIRKMGKGADYMVSECPLAAKHLAQVMGLGEQQGGASSIQHPVEIMALAYRLTHIN